MSSCNSCSFLKDESMCSIVGSGSVDCSDYVPADYGYNFLKGDGFPPEDDKSVHYSTHVDWVGPEPTLTVKPTHNTVITTVTTPKYLSCPDYDSFVVHVPKTEKVIKNIKVLKCKCCDGKLDSSKMKDNIIKCEYCDSDNYVELEDE